jgi:hypothetical protein
VTDETPKLITYDASTAGSLVLNSSQIQALTITPPPTISIHGDNGSLLVAVHPDGRLEYGPDYEPDDAARRFWEGVEQAARNIQYGPPMNATINARLKTGEEAERKVQRLRALAEQWQAAMRPGEKHPAAAAVLAILDGRED